jgi:hypothetical protein
MRTALKTVRCIASSNAVISDILRILVGAVGLLLQGVGNSPDYLTGRKYVVFI